MLNKILLHIFLFVQSGLLLSESSTKNIELFSIKELNSDFGSIVDSIIDFEKKCDYYTDSLFFCISVTVYPEKSDSIYIDVESGKDKMMAVNLEPIAFFRRSNHCFFIYGAIPARLFPSVDACPATFSYEITERTDDIMINDDSHSYWIYLFYNNKFSLLRTFSWCD